MNTQTQTAKAADMSTTQHVRTSRKGKTMKGLIAAMALATLGFGAPAYANISVFSDQAMDLGFERTFLRFGMTVAKPYTTGGKTCVIQYIDVDYDHPMHDKAFVTFIRALEGGGKLYIAGGTCAGNVIKNPSWISIQ